MANLTRPTHIYVASGKYGHKIGMAGKVVILYDPKMTVIAKCVNEYAAREMIDRLAAVMRNPTVK